MNESPEVQRGAAPPAGAPRPLTDEDLMADVQRGSRDALARLVDLHAKPILNLLWRFTGDRAVGEMRHTMGKNGGNLAEAGAVGWMFHRKGEISIPKEAASEDKLLDLVLEAGAEDLKDDGSAWYVVTPPEALETVKEALAKAGITPASAEIGMVPQNYVKLTGSQAQQMLRLIEALEEHDDVQHVYANFDIDESEIQAAVGAN